MGKVASGQRLPALNLARICQSLLWLVFAKINALYMNDNKNFWWKDAVIYEAYVDKFSGDFKDFVSAAHAKGIKVIVDLVLNHVSVEHLWFKEAKNSAASPKRAYFLWSKTGREFSGSVNPFFHLKAGNWIYNSGTDDYYYASFFPEQADLNWDNPEIFTEVIRITDFWAKLGVDGLRLDAVAHLIKREGTLSLHQPKVHDILKDMRKYLDINYPGVIMLAEASGKIEQVIQYFGNGDECHMVFNFPLMSNIYLAVKRNDMKPA